MIQALPNTQCDNIEEDGNNPLSSDQLRQLTEKTLDSMNRQSVKWILHLECKREFDEKIWQPRAVPTINGKKKLT